jgi:hypothetical protein
MSIAIARERLNPLEMGTLVVGFLLVGIAIAVTTVSYALNMTFQFQWLVWVITAAFGAVALITLAWPLAFRNPPGAVPEGRLRQLLLLSLPVAYILGSQVCGLGLASCGVACTAINLSLIGLATGTAVQIHRGKSVGALLIPMVILGLAPHCVCAAPINTIWHGMFGGVSPTCNMVPLAVTLFSVTALRGIKPRASATLSGVLTGMIVFMAVGNPLVGFPWTGCV